MDDGADRKFSFLGETFKQNTLQNAVTFNEPFEFKGIKFYPVMLDKLIQFYTCAEILKIKQERVGNKKLMKLPYLWFLAYAYEKADQFDRLEFYIFIPLLYALIEMTTGSNRISMKVERKDNGDYKKCFLCIDDVEFNNKDFLEIRQIIFTQAGIEHSDEFINEDAEQAIAEGHLNEQKKSGYIQPSHDDLISKFCMYMKKSKEEAKKEYSIRDFNKILNEICAFEDWRIVKTAEMSGMVKFPNPIAHWFSGREKPNIYKDQNINYQGSNIMKIGS